MPNTNATSRSQHSGSENGGDQGSCNMIAVSNFLEMVIRFNRSRSCGDVEVVEIWWSGTAKYSIRFRIRRWQLS